MLKFISFGSGSSGNCYYLFTPNDGLLIDMGVGIRVLKKSFKEYGLSLDKVHHILITHDHADHIKSVGSFSAGFKVKVYATHRVHEGINHNYCVTTKLNPERVCYVEKGETFQVGDFTVTPFGVPHDSNDNVGYQIKCGDVVFCLMTDVGHVTDEMLEYISSANYLVMEANHDPEMLRNGPYPDYLKQRISGPNGHLSNGEATKAIAEHMTEKLHHVWLCHLSEENNHPELARKTVDQILRSYGIVPGKDLQLDVLKRKNPSEIFELI